MAGPNRPATERDVVQTIAGQPVFLGVITSTAAAAVNNSTTAVPFNVRSGAPGAGFQGSLAGKVLLLQSTAAGLILPNPNNPPLTTPAVIVQQATTPVFSPPPLQIPGILLGINERVEITMGQTTPYLDFVAVTGTASLLVYEMV